MADNEPDVLERRRVPDSLITASAAGHGVDVYRWRLVVVDVVVVVLAAALAFGIRFEDAERVLAVGRRTFDYSMVTMLIAVGWVVFLALGGVWDQRVIGRGTTEFRRLARSTLFFFGAIGVLAYLLKAELARGFVAVALPAGFVGLFLAHGFGRRWLTRQHRAGRMLTDVVVVGQTVGACYLGRRLQSSADSGYRVIGMCVPANALPTDAAFPVVGTLDGVADAVRRLGAKSVAVASSDSFGPGQVRALAWQLEGTGVRILLSPSLVDVAGPRIHIRPVAGLPLMQVEEPRFSGPRLVLKTGMDILGGSIGLLVLSPLLLLLAIAVRSDDGGPALFRQTRVGLGGRTFPMWKFRSMHLDAEQRLAQLEEQSEGNGVLFKMKDDPRVTRIGKILRRFSLDELPQLFNVVAGQMSLVGPRPPLAREVALYSQHVHRRFLVKPGLTGLWQISGRSDLTWEESVRLDLYYVENWSLTGDLSILAKTVRVVAGKSGAY